MATTDTRRLSEDTSEQLKDAVLRVATLGGLRAITIQAIADEAGCSKGTAGIVPIATHLAELIEQVFDPYFVLLAEFTAYDWELTRCLNRIDELFSHEPQTAVLTVQICALGLVNPASRHMPSQATSPSTGYSDAQENRANFVRRKQLAALVAQAHMLENGIRYDLVPRSERLVEHYLVSAFRHTLVHDTFPLNEPD